MPVGVRFIRERSILARGNEFSNGESVLPAREPRAAASTRVRRPVLLLPAPPPPPLAWLGNINGGPGSRSNLESAVVAPTPLAYVSVKKIRFEPSTTKYDHLGEAA